MKEKDITEGEKLYQILVNDKFGFINKAGKMVIEPKYDIAPQVFPKGLLQ